MANTNLNKTTGSVLTAADVNKQLAVSSDGNWGIGTDSPSDYIEFMANHNTTSPGSTPILRLENTRTSSGTSAAELLFASRETDSTSHTRALISGQSDGGGDDQGRMGFYTANSAGTLSPAVTISHLQYMGLGTESPGAVLDVRNVGGEDILNLYDGSTEVLTVLDGGNVGLSTDSPNTNLEVSKDTDGAVIRISSKQDDSSHVVDDPLGALEFWSADATAPSEPIKCAIRALQENVTGHLLSLAFFTMESERMRIDSSGNIGIGTDSPSSELDIGGDISLTGTAGTLSDRQINFQNGGLEKQWAILTTTDGQPGGNSGTDLTVARYNDTGGLIGTVITFKRNSGYVGIGTAPGYQLTLSADSAGKPSTNTWTISSDERLKENIVLADLDRCIEIIKSVPLKRYTWKETAYSDEKVKDRSKLGWVAQDVQAVFPKAVNTGVFKGEQTGTTIEEYQEEGVTKTREVPEYANQIDDCLDLNADQLYAVMYGAIQKQQEIIESLTARIETLESA